MRGRHVILVAATICTVLLCSQINLLLKVSLGSKISKQMSWQGKPAISEENARIYSYSTTDVKTAELFLNQQPRGYPWGVTTSTYHQQDPLDFSLLWERVYHPDALVPPLGVGPPLYMIREGKLYLWKNHFNRTNNHPRVTKYQKLIKHGLDLYRQLQFHISTTIDPRIIELVTQPLPLFITHVDFRKCWDKTYPIFTYATFASANNTTVIDGNVQRCIPIGMPGYYDGPFTRPLTGEVSWDSIFRQQNHDYPWDTKIREAIWRGSTTGSGDPLSDWKGLPRVQLVEYSLRNTTKYINAGFSKIVQRNETETEEIKKRGLLKESIPKQDFGKYKAIIDIDGNSWSSRFASLLCMNSVVIKIQPQWVDYFHPELVPFVHYLPVNQNLSNLQEMVNLAMNDTMSSNMQAIVKNANIWCKEKFTGLQLTADMVWIIISYMELLKNENISSGNFSRWKEQMNDDSASWKQNWHEV